jgi:hypothetical protein
MREFTGKEFWLGLSGWIADERPNAWGWLTHRKVYSKNGVKSVGLRFNDAIGRPCQEDDAETAVLSVTVCAPLGEIGEVLRLLGRTIQKENET